MNPFLQADETTVASNAYTQKAHARLCSAEARQSLSETLTLSQKAIAQLNEARRVRPEQLNTPTTL